MDTDRELQEKLKAWRVEIEVPPGFQREVWAKIGARDRGAWRDRVAGLSALLARPAFAAGVVLVAAAASLAVAHVHASQANAERWETMEMRYFASLDPYFHLSEP